jgi:sorting nexin-25
MEVSNPREAQRSEEVFQKSKVSIGQFLGVTLGCLFVIKFRLPFLSLILIVLLAVFCSVIIGIALIHLPKNEENHTRTRFPKLKFTKNDEWKREMEHMQNSEEFSEPEDTTEFNQAADVLIQLILRDFIRSWFQSISSYESFPNEVRHQLRLAFYELEKRAAQIDFSKCLIIDIMPILTRHFANYCSAEENVLTENGTLGSVELDLKIAKEYDSISKVNQYISFKDLDNEAGKKHYSREKVSQILEYLIPSDELGCGPVFVLIREIITNMVLFPVLRLLSDSDFWNQTVVTLASSTLKSRTQVRELRDAIDKQYNSPHAKQYKTDLKGVLFDEKITPQMKEQEFQKCIKNIEKSNSMASLKQLKYYIAVQISRTHRINSKSEKFVKYTKRLNIVKSRVDNRIRDLSEPNSIPPNRRRSMLNQTDLDDFISQLTLSQLLSNPSSLSFFKDFMEQRSRTTLLQFWMAVNDIRDPLEDPQNPDYEEEMVSSMDLAGGDVIKQIFENFFSERLLKVDEEAYAEVEAFANGKERNIEKYIKARKQILVLQSEVFHRMEHRDLPDFKSSELFLKLLTSETFEQSLVNEVDEIRDDDVEDELIYNKEDDEESSLLELENALTDILNKGAPQTDLSLSNSSDILPKKTEELKNDLFGSQDNGFLNEKPLFDDNDYELEDEVSKLDNNGFEADPDFFQVSHDVLNLKENISQLEHEIEKLSQQSEMLDPLILKAELTNSTNELRLLKKSKASFSREIESKESVKQQLIVQENENSLFGKTTVDINSWLKSHSKGRDYIVYVIEIDKASSTEGKSSSSWIIGRRFSQFYQMNEILRKQYPEVEGVPFPKKKIVLRFQQRSLIDERRSQLEQYLRRLLEMPKICQNKEFRRFLTIDDYRASTEQSSEGPATLKFEIKDAASKLYSGLSSSIDILNSRPASTDNLKLEESEVLAESEQAEDMRRELETYESGRIQGQSFVKPITELFIALFPLNNSNSWIRGRAIIVIFQKLLGNTIERYIRDQVDQATSTDRMIELLNMITDILWPDGKFAQTTESRSTSEKESSRREARVLLEKLMTDMLSKIVGQSGSKSAAVRVHAMLQNDLLTLALLYDVLDKLLDQMFPELKSVIR